MGHFLAATSLGLRCFRLIRCSHWRMTISAPFRVLVVDDFALWRSYIVAKLAENPVLHVVGFSSSGLEAVQQTAELQPDLVLMDINLPNLTGISADRRIQESPLSRFALPISV